MEQRLELQRIYEDDRTIGRYQWGNKKWCCLELPDRNNEQDESCISPGLYECEKYQSSTFKRECIRVLNVVGRTGICIHPGNYTTQILGCQLPGLYFKDIDGDGTLDVARSGDALDEMLAVLPDKFLLHIKN
jgi:hypothetical protein